MSSKSIAFLDLLGTASSTSKPSTYKHRISTFTRIITDYSEKLGSNSTISFFSDCMYVQSDSISCMVDYLATIRDVLMSYSIYFSAAVKQGELDVSSSKNNRDAGKCKVSGVSFQGENIAELYRFQDTFKGIGVRLDEDSIKKLGEEAPQWSKRIVPSFFVPDVGKQCEKFYDIAFDVYTNDFHNEERQIVKTLLMDAMHSNSRAPKYGRFYTAILITLLQSYRSRTIIWDDNTFKVAPALYRIILDFATDENKMSNLYGLEYMLLTLLDILYTKDIGRENKRQISRKILDSIVIKKKYSLFEKIPNELFSEENKEKIIKDYQSNIAAEILEKFSLS